MEKVKTFFARGNQVKYPESNRDGITNEINRWLSKMEGEIEIIDRVMSSSGNFLESAILTVMIFYRKKGEKNEHGKDATVV